MVKTKKIMSIINPPFKKPPKKYVPKGLDIIYEDREIIVVDKMYGLLTMGTDREKEKTAYYLLQNYVKKGNSSSKSRVFIVHRLDKDTSGVLVFAKNEKAKRYLQDEWQSFSKTYCAVVQGNLEKKEGVFESYLAENKGYMVYVVKDPEMGKVAKTGYKVVRESAAYSLVEVTLHTGRKHQIRVQFAANGNPVAGDKVYGKKLPGGGKRLMLHSLSLTINHPFSKKEMTFKSDVPASFKTLVKDRPEGSQKKKKGQ